MILSSNLGYPRIGFNRELKWLLESFWKKKINENNLLENTSNIKKNNWINQRKAGIHFIPSNDFSLYDHVLDMCLTLNAIPERFKKLRNKKTNLELYFAMARGFQDGKIDIKAMEMTKWFDTNYHYIVPEFKPNQKFKLISSKIIDEFLEAKSFGIITRPVILGPLSFLYLGKSTSNKFNKLNLLSKLIPIYRQIFKSLKNHGAEWIQVDEPILSLDLEKKFKAEINPSVFTSVIGLATRKLDVFGYYKFVTGVKNINLLPNRDLVRKSKRTEWISKLGFIGASAFALFFIITSTFSYFGEMKKTKKQLTDYTALEQNVNTMKTKLTKVNTQIKNIETKVKIGEAIHSNQKSSFLVLSHINKSVPKGIKLMSLNYDGNKKLVIIGSAKGDQNILDFISKLKKGKEIKNAIVKSMSNIVKDKDNPSNLKKFTIDTIINTEQPKKEKEE